MRVAPAIELTREVRLALAKLSRLLLSSQSDEGAAADWQACE